MREDALGGRRKPFLIGGLAVLAVGAFGWMTWSSLAAKGGTPGSLKPAAMCSACGFHAEGSTLKLEGTGAARAPIYGPGYKCPKCGKQTLYVNPLLCQKCKAPFLFGQSGAGKTATRCPKCGGTG
jgi:hypothetical protein